MQQYTSVATARKLIVQLIFWVKIGSHNRCHISIVGLAAMSASMCPPRHVININPKCHVSTGSTCHVIIRGSTYTSAVVEPTCLVSTCGPQLPHQHGGSHRLTVLTFDAWGPHAYCNTTLHLLQQFVFLWQHYYFLFCNTDSGLM